MRKPTQRFLAVACMFSCLQNASAQNTSPYWSLAGNSNATTSSKLGTTNAVSLRFFANNVQRMLVGYSSGNVSIGATTLDARLTVNAATGSNIFLGQANGTTKLRGASNGGFSIGSGSTPPTNGLYVAGNVGIGTATPANKLSVAGSGIYTTAVRINNGGLRVTNNWSTGDSSVGIYAEGGIGVSASGMTGVYGTGMTGVVGQGYMGVTGEGSSGGSGVSGYSDEGNGVYGSSNSQTGVQGESSSGNGGNFTSQSGWGVRASTETGTYAGVFYGKVWASAGYVTSDKNLKQNVTQLSDAMTLINKLKPREYQFKTDSKYGFLHLEKGSHYGLLAQDVEDVLPNLVSTSTHVLPKTAPVAGASKTPGTAQQIAAKEPEETMRLKGVNYVEIIPILIKGLQEQQAQIEALRTEINQLKQTSHAVSAVSFGTLEQNRPNPAKGTTYIAYSIPAKAASAQLVLTDALGKILKTLSLPPGNSGVTLNTGNLSSGTYTYILVVDGNTIESRKLTIQR